MSKTITPKSREVMAWCEIDEQLADAYVAIACANHYMVGLVEEVTEEERSAARDILITRQNEGEQSGSDYDLLELALDLLDNDTKS